MDEQQPPQHVRVQHPGYPTCRCAACAHDYICPSAVVRWLRALLVTTGGVLVALAFLPPA